LEEVREELVKSINPTRLDNMRAARKALRLLRQEHDLPSRAQLLEWIRQQDKENWDRYSSHLYSESDESALNVKQIEPRYSEDSSIVDGREVLQKCFDAALERDPCVLAFGEDVGMIGDVNQGFAGLQKKHGELR